jgi:chromosome segregation ATPase
MFAPAPSIIHSLLLKMRRMRGMDPQFGTQLSAFSSTTSLQYPSTELMSCRLDAKIDEIDKKLIKYKEQISSAKTQAAQRAAKQQALRSLKQKKMYENQRDSMMAQQMNLESANFMTEQLKDTADQIAVMKQAQGAIAAQMKQVNIDDVEDLQEQMQDLWVRTYHLVGGHKLKLAFFSI